MPRRHPKVLQQEAPRAPLSSPAPPIQTGIVTDPAEAARMLACDRDNPAKLGGEALKRLAHSRGVPRSECDRSSDEQLRRQMQHITYREFDEAA